MDAREELAGALLPRLADHLLGVTLLVDDAVVQEAHGVGDLPREWNHLVGYDPPRRDAKLVHYTQGMPIFEETTGSEYKAEWMAEHEASNSTQGWQELMAHSVHAAPTAEGRRVAKLHPQAMPQAS